MNSGTTSFFTLIICLFISVNGFAFGANSPIIDPINEEALPEKSKKPIKFSGTVSGTIIEAGTGETLIGANVIVKGTLKGASADTEGKFSIRGIDAGPQVLVASYLGFKSKEIPVVIVDGENIEVEITLEWEGVQGEEVTITAQARGQVAAINQQLASNTISNIVSKDRIQELPDVNAAESIGRLPGIAIQRSGGEANKVLIRGLSPKFSTVTVNGVRIPSTGASDRSVDLSLISSNMLDGIEVKKAITPDMDADAIAGSVDLKLRNAPNELLFDVQAQGGYTQLQDYYQNYKVSGTVSNRFLDSKLGVIATFNADQYDRSADQLNAGYSRFDFPSSDDIGVRITSVQAQERNSLKKRAGASFVLDYELPKGKIAGNTFFNQIDNNGLVRTNNIFGGRIGSRLNISDGTTSIFTSSIGIEQDLGWIQLDGGVSRTSSLSKNPRDYYVDFRMESPAEGVDNSFPFDSIGIQPIGVLPFTRPNDSTMVLGTTNIFDSRRDETNYTAQFNTTLPFELGDKIDGFIKTGFKVRWLDKTNDQNQIGKTNWPYVALGYNDVTGEPTNSDGTVLRCIYEQTGLLNGFDVYQEQVVNGETSPFRYIPIHYFDTDYDRDNFLTGEGGSGFPVGFTPSEDDIRAFINAADNCMADGVPVLVEDVNTSRANDYSGEERYDAAYIMSEINIGKYVTFIPGIRWEHDYSRFSTERFTTVSGLAGGSASIRDLDTLDVTRDYNFILPMVHLQVNPNEWLKIRLARTETLARPDFTQYIPRANINSMRTQVNANNSNLRPAEAVNYDISASVYQNHIGLFSVSGFHKNISDLPLWKRSFAATLDTLPPSESLNIPIGRDFDGDGVADEDDWLANDPQITTYINSPFDTKVWGVEFDWQTNFWYLPSFFKGLVLNINYTRMFSETSYQSTVLAGSECIANCGTPFQESVKFYKDTLRTNTRALDQPAHLANVTLGYDYKGFSTRFSYLFQGDRLTNVPSATEPVRDSYSARYERWDLTVKQRVNEVLEVFGNFSNLTSTPDRNLVGGDGDRSLGFGSSTFVQYYGFTMDVGVRMRF